MKLMTTTQLMRRQAIDMDKEVKDFYKYCSEDMGLSHPDIEIVFASIAVLNLSAGGAGRLRGIHQFLLALDLDVSKDHLKELFDKLEDHMIISRLHTLQIFSYKSLREAIFDIWMERITSHILFERKCT